MLPELTKQVRKSARSVAEDAAVPTSCLMGDAVITVIGPRRASTAMICIATIIKRKRVRPQNAIILVGNKEKQDTLSFYE